MPVPIYTLKEVKLQGGTEFDRLLAVLIEQHVSRTNFQVGQVLTAIEAALGDSVEGKAVKSIAKEAIWSNAVRFEETDLIGTVSYFAQKMGSEVRLYRDRDGLGRYLFGESLEDPKKSQEE